MKYKTKYRTLKPMDSVRAGDALYVDGVFILRFYSSNAIPAVCFTSVTGCICGRTVEVRRKHKQRNKTKARWL